MSPERERERESTEHDRRKTEFGSIPCLGIYAGKSILHLFEVKMEELVVGWAFVQKKYRGEGERERQ